VAFTNVDFNTHLPVSIDSDHVTLHTSLAISSDSSTALPLVGRLQLLDAGWAIKFLLDQPTRQPVQLLSVVQYLGFTEQSHGWLSSKLDPMQLLDPVRTCVEYVPSIEEAFRLRIQSDIAAHYPLTTGSHTVSMGDCVWVKDGDVINGTFDWTFRAYIEFDGSHCYMATILLPQADVMDVRLSLSNYTPEQLVALQKELLLVTYTDVSLLREGATVVIRLNTATRTVSSIGAVFVVRMCQPPDDRSCTLELVINNFRQYPTAIILNPEVLLECWGVTLTLGEANEAGMHFRDGVYDICMTFNRHAVPCNNGRVDQLLLNCRKFPERSEARVTAEVRMHLIGDEEGETATDLDGVLVWDDRLFEVDGGMQVVLEYEQLVNNFVVNRAATLAANLPISDMTYVQVTYNLHSWNCRITAQAKLHGIAVDMVYLYESETPRTERFELTVTSDVGRQQMYDVINRLAVDHVVDQNSVVLNVGQWH